MSVPFQITGGGKSSASLPPITGGSTTGGLLVNTDAVWSTKIPPSYPGNLSLTFWSKNGEDKDNYALFQAGNTQAQRNYLGFVDFDGAYRWLTGKNASNSWIVYDAVFGAHRMVCATATLLATITNISETSGSVVTLTCTNTFSVSDSIQLYGLTVGTWLNGQAVTLLAGTSGSQIVFNDPTTHGTQASTAETGTAMRGLGGATYLNGLGGGAVILNGATGLDAGAGTGGIEVHDGTTTAVFTIAATGITVLKQNGTAAPAIAGGAGLTVGGSSSSTPLYIYINAASSTEPNYIQFSSSTGKVGLIFTDHTAGSGNVDGMGWSANGQHAFYVNNGFTTPALVMKTDNTIQFGKALVALGGGAAPTFGTIGGSGPATAAQNTWMQFKDSGGNNFWVPVWK